MKFMHQAIVIFLILLLSACNNSTNDTIQLNSNLHQGKLLTEELIETLSKEEIQNTINENIDNSSLIHINHALKFYKITYETIDVQLQSTVASGAIVVPENFDAALPIISFQHGTAFKKNDAPSIQGFDILNMVLGTEGFIVFLPDYLGLGVSELFHPYHHAKSTASAGIDMIKASLLFLNNHKIKYNPAIFLAGYSEGGYATMAMQASLTTEPINEFTIKASAPMAGAYDPWLSAKLMIKEKYYHKPSYLAYLINAYTHIYSDIHLDAVFDAKYLEIIKNAFNNELNSSEFDAQLTQNLLELFDETFSFDLQNNVENPLRKHLIENQVFHFKPEVPTRLYHCIEDTSVSAINAIQAYESFLQLGSKSVELKLLDEGDHEACAPISIYFMLQWFKEILKEAA